MNTLDLKTGRKLFGSVAQAYDHFRPDYASDLYALLESRCGLRPDINIVEIGPGTGQATRALLRYRPRQITAVEPDVNMAELLTKNTNDPKRLTVIPTACEQAELPQNHFDLGVAAMSFHWVNEPSGLKIVSRALKKGAWWAMWWTQFGDPERPDPFKQATHHIFENITLGPTSSGKGGTHHAHDSQARLAALSADFEEAELTKFEGTLELSAQDLRGLYSTFSPILALPATHRERTLDELERIAEVEFGGKVIKPTRTLVYTARRT